MAEDRERFVLEEGDCYTVAREDGGSFLVRHFPNRETRRACCQVRVTLGADDRARAIPDADTHGESACLHRAYLEIEGRHAR